MAATHEHDLQDNPIYDEITLIRYNQWTGLLDPEPNYKGFSGKKGKAGDHSHRILCEEYFPGKRLYTEIIRQNEQP